jgi:hypothetical protein
MSKSAATTVATGVHNMTGTSKRFITDISWELVFFCFSSKSGLSRCAARSLFQAAIHSTLTSLALLSIPAVNQWQSKDNSFAAEASVASIFCEKWVKIALDQIAVYFR